MKDIERVISVNGVEYPLVFNLNVMEAILDEYKTIERWGSLTDGSKGEPNAKAVIFGFTQMINEGLDIWNDKDGKNRQMLTTRKVGRIITQYGLLNATKAMNDTVVDSTKSNEKNA